MQDARRRLLMCFALLATGLGGCSHELRQAGPAADPAPAVVVVQEAWLSAFDSGDDVDSVAVDPGRGMVIATTKATHQLLVLDAANGALRVRIGGPGAELGRFMRPNGIAVVGDLALVVERDNHRVQVLRLPALTPLTVLGEDVLERPYGIAAAAALDGNIELWVTDNFDGSSPGVEVDPSLAERVRHWQLVDRAGAVAPLPIASFGEVEGRGALHKVETIGIDPVRRLLLVADETPERMGLVVYTADGSFTGTVIGSDVFRSEPEGIALWSCGDGGYWIATDQHELRSVFHLFDRRSFKHVGAFSGKVTANTDGVGITTESLPGFPEGAFFAVHDDGAVAAFDLEKVATAVGVSCR
jgi:3-phytase